MQFPDRSWFGSNGPVTVYGADVIDGLKQYALDDAVVLFFPPFLSPMNSLGAQDIVKYLCGVIAKKRVDSVAAVHCLKSYKGAERGVRLLDRASIDNFMLSLAAIARQSACVGAMIKEDL